MLSTQIIIILLSLEFKNNIKAIIYFYSHFNPLNKMQFYAQLQYLCILYICIKTSSTICIFNIFELFKVLHKFYDMH